MQGLAQAAAVLDPKSAEYAAGQFASGLAGSVVPNIIARATRAIDPAVRDIRGEKKGLAGVPEEMGKSIQSRLPGLSSRLPARRTMTGEEMKRESVGGPLEQFASPSPISRLKTGMVETELASIGYAPGKPDRTIKMPGGEKVGLNSEEYNSLMDARKKAAVEFMSQIKKSYYLKLDNEAKMKTARAIFDGMMDEARGKIIESKMAKLKQK